jgi:small-conductance mechanosensitive channel
MNIVDYPPLNRFLLAVMTIALAFVVSVLINQFLMRRLAALATRSRGEWDDVVIGELRRRIPLWGLLIGLALSLGYWDIPGQWLKWVQGAIGAVAVWSVTSALAAMASRLLVSFGTPGHPVSGLVQNILRFVIWTVGLLIIARSFGVEISPILAALGVGGLAVALALQDPLSNLFSGIFVTVAGQIRIGDYIRTDLGVEGTVTDFNWHSTRIQAPSGDLIVVPNARLAKAIVTNFNLPVTDVGFNVELAVAHGSDLAVVERVTLEVAREVQKDTDGAIKAFDPVIRVLAFTEIGIRIAVTLKAAGFPEQTLLKHELLRRLAERYRAEGIALARGLRPHQ